MKSSIRALKEYFIDKMNWFWCKLGIPNCSKSTQFHVKWIWGSFFFLFLENRVSKPLQPLAWCIWLLLLSFFAWSFLLMAKHWEIKLVLFYLLPYCLCPFRVLQVHGDAVGASGPCSDYKHAHKGRARCLECFSPMSHSWVEDNLLF